jgi:Skp family chaperone for outer membrane proteins
MNLRFKIRDLFWLLLVAALAVGWWSDHRALAPKAAKADEQKILVNGLEHLLRSEQEAKNELEDKYRDLVSDGDLTRMQRKLEQLIKEMDLAESMRKQQKANQPMDNMPIMYSPAKNLGTELGLR